MDKSSNQAQSALYMVNLKLIFEASLPRYHDRYVSYKACANILSA